MKAIVLHQAGNFDNLMIAEIPVPKVGTGEVLVKVVSLTINPVDYKVRADENLLSSIFGSDRPVVLGWDLSGEIVEVGDGVEHFNPGDEVFGMINFPGIGNAYAEFVAAPVSHIALKPKNIPHLHAAAATLSALTALQVFTKKKVKKGDHVLIDGASGGVGHFAVQIAKYSGAHVTGTSSLRNRDFVLALGADVHINYLDQNFEDLSSRFDFVLDTLGGENINKVIALTRPGGCVVTISGGGVFSDQNKQAARIKGVDLSFLLVQSSGEDMKKIADMLASGILRPHVSKLFDFGALADAHRYLEIGRTVGKIGIRV